MNIEDYKTYMQVGFHTSKFIPFDLDLIPEGKEIGLTCFILKHNGIVRLYSQYGKVYLYDRHGTLKMNSIHYNGRNQYFSLKKAIQNIIKKYPQMFEFIK